MYDIATGLRKARLEAGMTQQQLADAAGVTRRSLYNWETGRSGMSLYAALQLADALNISTDKLSGRCMKDFSADKVKF